MNAKRYDILKIFNDTMFLILSVNNPSQVHDFINLLNKTENSLDDFFVDDICKSTIEELKNFKY